MKRLLLALVALSTGCAGYPIVKPDAFKPKPPKVAILAYDTTPVTAGSALPFKVDSVDDSYAVLRQKLASANEADLVADQVVHDAQAYNQLAPPLIDMYTTAKLLRPVFLGAQQMASLAKALNVDAVVTVHAAPQVELSTAVMGVGTADVVLTTVVSAYDATGNRIWEDHLTTTSDTFATAGGVQSPTDVKKGIAQAMMLAANQLPERLSSKLAAK